MISFKNANMYYTLLTFTVGSVTSETEADQHMQTSNEGVTYQASSPDEVALVQWTQQVGLTLSRRDLTSMQLRAPDGRLYNYSILQVFPFTSETKRMGIIVKVCNSLLISALYFYDLYTYFPSHNM